MTEQY